MSDTSRKDLEGAGPSLKKSGTARAWYSLEFAREIKKETKNSLNNPGQPNAPVLQVTKFS